MSCCIRNSYNDDISNTNNCVYSTVIYIYLYYMLVNCQKKFLYVPNLTVARCNGDLRKLDPSNRHFEALLREALAIQRMKYKESTISVLEIAVAFVVIWFFVIT